MKCWVAAVALTLTTTLHAQDLPPELLPAATKYRADTAALSTQQKAAMDRVAQVYGAALDTAEKAETAGGHVTAISAITQERGDLQKNELKAESPGNLPKSLHTARKTYLEGVARVAGDFGQRQQRVAADYIRALSTLQTRAGNNAALAGQITKEKERALKAAAAYGSAEFEYRLMGINWNWESQFQVNFQPGGTSSGTGSGRDLKWKTLKPYTIKFTFPNGNHGTIEFDQGMTRGAITQVTENGEIHHSPLLRAKK